MRPRRLLVLAEGHSGDPHHGKTARGVIRYRREDVVAVLDSQSEETEHEGLREPALRQATRIARARAERLLLVGPPRLRRGEPPHECLGALVGIVIVAVGEDGAKGPVTRRAVQHRRVAAGVVQNVASHLGRRPFRDRHQASHVLELALNFGEK